MALRGANCTPEEIVAQYPCLNCLSDSDLDKLLLVIWANYQYGTFEAGEVSTLIEDCKCYPCLTNKQKKISEIVAMIPNTSLTAESVIEIVKCLPCMVPETVRAIIACLKCQFWSTHACVELV